MIFGLHEGFALLCLLAIRFPKTSAAVIDQSTSRNALLAVKIRRVGRDLIQCLDQPQKFECLSIKVLEILDRAVKDNDAWRFADFVVIRKTPTSKPINVEATQYTELKRSTSDRICERLLELFRTRSISLELPKWLDFSDVREQITGGEGVSHDARITDYGDKVGTNDGNDINKYTHDQRSLIKEDPKIKRKISAFKSPTELGKSDEGRKKNYKGKHVFMMGGMTLVALLAQMFLGKVILIAGAAFMMAKMALMVSVLNSLKKGHGGGHGGATEHVILSSGSGAHGFDSENWHRSIRNDYRKPKIFAKHNGRREWYPANTGEANFLK